MKSIYEKAEEAYSKTTATSDLCNEKFVEGANYVLDKIEKVIQADFNSHSPFKLKTIKQIIEQLKK